MNTLILKIFAKPGIRRLLIDEYLLRSAVEILRIFGHEATGVRDIGLRGTIDLIIASYARKNGLCLLISDFDFSDVRNYLPIL